MSVTDLDALLAAVVHSPADDTPRGAYADRLDDAGEHEYAEFVRVQVELARSTTHCYHDLTQPPGCSVCSLRRREWELFDAHSREWFDVDGPAGFAVGLDPTRRPSDPDVLGIVRRGFVDELRCDLRTFVGGECRCLLDWETTRNYVRAGRREPQPDCPDCAGTGRVGLDLAAVFSRWPVTRVVLVGAEPRVGERDGEPDAYAWSYRRGSEGESFLPWELYRRLRGGRPDELLGTLLAVYPSHAAALDALSAAAVSLGRTAAGLPAL